MCPVPAPSEPRWLYSITLLAAGLGWAGVWIPNVPVSDDTTATAMLPSNTALYTRNLPET